MKLVLDIEIRRTTGKNVEASEVRDVLIEEIESMDLYVDDTNFEIISVEFREE